MVWKVAIYFAEERNSRAAQIIKKLRCKFARYAIAAIHYDLKRAPHFSFVGYFPQVTRVYFSFSESAVTFGQISIL